MTKVPCSGIEPGQRHLNGPQTAGREHPYGTTPPLLTDVGMIGPIELQLDAACAAPDTAFIAVLQHLDENENAVNVASGYLRAGLRSADENVSKPGAPNLPCRDFQSSPVWKQG